MNELHLFAGDGGGVLAGKLRGASCVCLVEIEKPCRDVLLQRMRDGIIDRCPIWDDVQTFDGNPWRGIVQKVCGGFPCQDLSIANPNGQGLDGSRSGLWHDMWRIIGEIQPDYVEVENSWRLVSGGLGGMLTQFAESGYDARWATMGGHDTGSCTDGKRVWIHLTKTNCERRQEVQGIQTFKPCSTASPKRQFERAISATWDEEADTRVRRNPDALARGMERLKAIGNGQDPFLAALAWNTLKQ